MKLALNELSQRYIDVTVNIWNNDYWNKKQPKKYNAMSSALSVCLSFVTLASTLCLRILCVCAPSESIAIRTKRTIAQTVLLSAVCKDAMKVEND